MILTPNRKVGRKVAKMGSYEDDRIRAKNLKWLKLKTSELLDLLARLIVDKSKKEDK